MRKSVAAHCPYCGKMINYFYLYDAKRSDFGYCSHCGGMYAVKYSPLAYLLVMGAMGALLGGFAFWYLANKTLPGADYLMLCTAVIVGLYFLMPLLITPRRVIVRGRLGGFPSPEYIPVHRKDRKRRNRKLAVKHQPEVLQPKEKDGGAKHLTDHKHEKPGRRWTIRKAKHLYREKKPSVMAQRLQVWGGRAKSASGDADACIKQRQTREKPGKGQ